MKWSVVRSDSLPPRQLELPEQLLNDRELPARLGEETVFLRWHQGLQTLYLRRPGNKMETCLAVRSVQLQEQPESASYSLVVERAHLQRGVLTFTIRSGISLPGSRSGEREVRPWVLRSPLTGKVLQLLKVAGQSVQLGDTIAVIEAMKMENKISAPRAGTLHKVSISPNAMVQVGDILAVIQ